jgi:transcriptional regulator with XRE-family HTH domain
LRAKELLDLSTPELLKSRCIRGREIERSTTPQKPLISTIVWHQTRADIGGFTNVENDPLIANTIPNAIDTRARLKKRWIREGTVPSVSETIESHVAPFVAMMPDQSSDVKHGCLQTKRQHCWRQQYLTGPGRQRYPVAMGTPEDFYVRLGKRIHQRRVHLGITQEQLGRRLMPQVTRASIANLEAGKQRVLAHTLVQLAKALDLSLEALAQEEFPPGGEDVAAELRKKLNLDPARFEKLAKDLGLEAKSWASQPPSAPRRALSSALEFVNRR